MRITELITGLTNLHVYAQNRLITDLTNLHVYAHNSLSQGRLALNPRLQLTAFYQKNTDDSSQNYYIRFSWEYQPLSFVYLIFNHQEFNPAGSKAVLDDNAIVKINILKQF